MVMMRSMREPSSGTSVPMTRDASERIRSVSPQFPSWAIESALSAANHARSSSAETSSRERRASRLLP